MATLQNRGATPRSAYHFILNIRKGQTVSNPFEWSDNPPDPEPSNDFEDNFLLDDNALIEDAADPIQPAQSTPDIPEVAPNPWPDMAAEEPVSQESVIQESVIQEPVTQEAVAEQKPVAIPESAGTTTVEAVDDTSAWELSGDETPDEETVSQAPAPEQQFEPVAQSPTSDALQTNTVSGKLSEKDREFILTAFEDIKHRLSFAAELSGERSLCRLTESSRKFVATALALATNNSDMLPRSFDVEEFERDTQLLEALEPIKKELHDLAQVVDQLIDAAGSDAFTAALEVYQVAKMSRRGEELDEFVTSANRQWT